MRRSRIFCAFIILLCLVIHAFPCFSADTSYKTYGKNLYRSLSKRLGKTRADYPNLTDEEFANFREIHTTGIAKGKLYRSSSPISTWGNRNTIADRLSELAGIKTIINLTDTNHGMTAHKGYSGSYYSRQNVIGLNVSTKFWGKEYQRGLAKGIRFMAANTPPYLIHCSLGKDRAGFTCAIVECLMGASWQEVERDYMTSFYNYFGIVQGTREYDFVVKNEIQGFLARTFGVKAEDMARINLSDYAERYLRGIGVSSQDIEALREKLSPPE